MNDWLLNLPVGLMALVVFSFTYLIALAIYKSITLLAVGERARSFKAVSPGILPPLGIVFGLFVGFTAVQVWSNNERANAAVDREASALRTVALLAGDFPGEIETRLLALIRDYISETAAQEWPMMAHRTASLRVAPQPLAGALKLTLSLTPGNQGQQIAQRELTTALENALEARRQRITISQAQVNWVKWACLYLQAICALLAIGFVHCDNRVASFITMGLFATGVASSVLLIAAHDRPFTGEISVGPGVLLQVMPEAEAY